MKIHAMTTSTLLLAFTLIALPAFAQDSDDQDDLDVSLTVLEAGESAENAINNLELPKQAGEQARGNGAFGLETASAARQGQDKAREGQKRAREGQQKAREARENAASLAGEAASQAQEKVKNDIARGALERIPGDLREKLPVQIPGRAQDARDNARGAAGAAESAAAAAQGAAAAAGAVRDNAGN